MAGTELQNTQLRQIDGGAVLLFSRAVEAQIERVWRAVSQPDQIGAWFVPTGPWVPVRELDTLLGSPVGQATVGEAPYEICWVKDDDRYDFRLAARGPHTLVKLSVPVDEPEDAPAAADFVDSYFDRLAPYLTGEDLAHLANVDLDETERRIVAYARRFGVDPARGLEMVAGIRAAVEKSAHAQPWHFEPSQEAADAFEVRMTAYVREHKEALDAAMTRHGDDDSALMTALDEWILPTATSVEQVGARHLFVLDRYLADESIAISDLESAWRQTHSDR